MLGEDLVDVAIDVFGGYCPAIVPANLPPGAANVCQDIAFPEAGARTRGGLAKYVFGGATQIGATASVNGLKTYLTPSGGLRLMIWDSLGNMFKENPQGTLNLINSRPYQNLFYESQTLFGREYQCFSNALGGYDIPRQFDDTNWDRVSQVGPGQAPSAGDENVSEAIAASAGGLFEIGPFNVASGSQAGYLVSLVLNGISGGRLNQLLAAFKTGDLWQVAGVGAGYNGTWAITTCVLSGVSQVTITYFSNVNGLAAVGAAGTVNLPYYVVVNSTSAVTPPAGVSVTIAGAGVGTYNATWTCRGGQLFEQFVIIMPNEFSIAASGGGTWTIAGNIVAGLHNVSVAFITRQGFITEPAPWTSWTAGGGKRVILGDIPTGPANISQRLLIFTPVITPPATQGTFYSLPSGSSQIATSTMLIPDNVTTTWTVDFNDTILIAGFNAEYLFSELELGECAFMLGYNSRTVFLGERGRVPNFNNLSFDGGFSGGAFNMNWPLGWTPDPVTGVGGNPAVAAGLPADWGDAYEIEGDGSNNVRGMIRQTAYQDELGVPIIAANTAYSVRVRLALAQFSGGGTAHINLQSALGGFTTAGLSVPWNLIPPVATHPVYAEFIAPLTDVPLANPPTDLVLQVYVDSGLVLDGVILFDSIEIFPTNTPYNSSVGRLSRAFNPESFDSVTGQVQIRPGDGQTLRAGFPLRNSLYLAKDHYLGYVTDDGVNEPASWAFTEVSATIGICGPNAVDWHEEWAVFAERSGLYICWGSDPVKLTPEIQNDATFTGRTSWSSINWLAASTIWVRIDRINKMILVGAPINGASTPNVVFMMDYRWLDSAEDIASSPLVGYSSFTGKMLAHGRGRRWALWSITANAMCFAERADGTSQPFFGNGIGNGLLYEQFDCKIQPTDNGVTIPWQYQTYAVPSTQEEQMYQLRSHRKLAGYLKFRALGVGTLNLAITTALRSTLLRGYTLSLVPAGDGERPLNLHGERFFVNFSNSGVGSWVQLERIVLCVKKDAAFLTRGVSS